MRSLRQPPRLFFALLVSFGIAVTALTLTPSPAVAAGAADAQAKELVRLINGERAFLGKRALKIDTFLAAKARDGAIACPNDASLVMAGRAKDFAVYGYPSNSHLLRLCTKYSALDAMRSWGYNTYRGEVTALNGGYGTGAHGYTYGCSPTLRTCSGSTTSSYYTAVRAVTNWVSSATHYAVITGNYDRIGCGAWIGSSGTYFYDCMVSRGGRSGTSTTKRATSGSGSGTAAQVAGATAAAASPFMQVFSPPADYPVPAAVPAQVALATAAATTVAATTRLAGPLVMSGTEIGRDGVPATAPAPPAPGRSRDLSLAASLATVVLCGAYWVLGSSRRRLPHGSAPRQPAG